MIEVQGIRIDPDSRRAWRGEEEVILSRKEFDLVHKLIADAGHIVSRRDLMREVWGTEFFTSSKTIDVHLGWLRRKLGDDTRRPTLISTIRGKGLRFEETPPTRPDRSDRSGHRAGSGGTGRTEASGGASAP